MKRFLFSFSSSAAAAKTDRLALASLDHRALDSLGQPPVHRSRPEAEVVANIVHDQPPRAWGRGEEDEEDACFLVFCGTTVLNDCCETRRTPHLLHSPAGATKSTVSQSPLILPTILCHTKMIRHSRSPFPNPVSCVAFNYVRDRSPASTRVNLCFRADGHDRPNVHVKTPLPRLDNTMATVRWSDKLLNEPWSHPQMHYPMQPICKQADAEIVQ